ncbi:MAG: PA14 domain-containing protein [Bdellovibrionota bacterium]|jgi:hypothetical protein
MAKKKDSVEAQVTYEKAKDLLLSLQKSLECIDNIAVAVYGSEKEQALLLLKAWYNFAIFQSYLNGENTPDPDNIVLDLQEVELFGTVTSENLYQHLSIFQTALHSDFIPESLPSNCLQDHYLTLRNVLAKANADLDKRFNRSFFDDKRKTAALYLVSICAVMICVAIVWNLCVPNPWRVSYFSNADLAGEPKIKSTEKIVSLKNRSKLRRVSGVTPSFSVRFESCIETKEDLKVNFELGSDDGSRLMIDDKIIINNWGAHSFLMKNATTVITPGKHKITVEYNDYGGGSELVLKAVPRTILDGKMLSAPNKDGKCL